MQVASLLAVRVGCEFVYEADAPTPAVLLVRPDPREHRVRAESWTISPPTPHHDYRDLYGNVCRRFTFAPGRTDLRYEATVDVLPTPADTDWDAREVAVERLPDEALVFTLPSRYCLSDRLSDRAWELFGAVAPGWTRVQAICDWVHANIAFAYGTSRADTTALDVLEAGTGVCRDFAHLAITFCRALNIPARYAFGYLPDIGVPPPEAPMDFCAWIEVFLGHRWWTFDPRNNARRIGHIVIARGRDALDVAMVTTYGTARLETMTVWADHVK
ncbi:MAG TPA: transglutaminase family protein [Candidatus Elarobacter sp.]|nr:transglutaminase family protein [Candidatus Elarobacter sp.]